MSPTENLPQIYARLMKNQGYGYGFYEPEDPKTLKPRMCGFINGNGQWQPIVDTSKESDLLLGGYGDIDDVVMARSSETEWKGTASKGVHAEMTTLETQASGDAAGLPVTGSVKFTMGESVQGGAVLLSNTSVIRKGYAV